jgi:hypothetical protein
LYTTAGRDILLTQTDTSVSHVGLLKSITAWRAGTVVEADFTGYARTAVTFGAAGDTTPAGGRQIANSGAVTFPQNTGANQDVIAYGLYSADTGGTLVAIGLLDTDQPIAGTVDASTDLITAYAHGLEADQRVFFMAAPFGTPPDVFAEDTAYYVLAAGLTADAFALSTSSGGSAVNATTSGEAMFLPYKSQTIATNATAELATGTVVIQL